MSMTSRARQVLADLCDSYVINFPPEHLNLLVTVLASARGSESVEPQPATSVANHVTDLSPPRVNRTSRLPPIRLARSTPNRRLKSRKNQFSFHKVFAWQ
jgi:hypothetical protein